MTCRLSVQWHVRRMTCLLSVQLHDLCMGHLTGLSTSVEWYVGCWLLHDGWRRLNNGMMVVGSTPCRLNVPFNRTIYSPACQSNVMSVEWGGCDRSNCMAVVCPMPWRSSGISVIGPMPWNGGWMPCRLNGTKDVVGSMGCLFDRLKSWWNNVIVER